jgi:Domain of unknown function (DUF4342)
MLGLIQAGTWQESLRASARQAAAHHPVPRADYAERMNERGTQRTQEFTLSGDEVVAKVRELIHAGNIRRITIKNEEGRTMLEVPLTIGLIGAALLPVFAAIGAAAALATRCTIVVERDVEPPGAGDTPA